MRNGKEAGDGTSRLRPVPGFDCLTESWQNAEDDSESRRP